MLRCVIFMIFLATVCVATTVKKCPEKPAPFAVRVEGCNNLPCKVIKGKNLVLEVDFGTDRKIENLTAGVMIAFGLIKRPYPMSNKQKDVCKNLENGTSCPILPGKLATYKLEIPTRRKYPNIQVEVELSIVDEFDNVVLCFSVNVQLISYYNYYLVEIFGI